MMFTIELIRKMFAYEQVYRKFEMSDFKFLLKLDNQYVDQKYFKKWIDKNNLVEKLREWLSEYKIEKSFSEVYVEDRTDVEILIDSIYEETDKEKRKKLLGNYLENIKYKNILD